MIVYIMRHGETIWNYKGIIQGRSRNRLSKKGIEQAKSQSLKYKDINFDVIISSPVFRAVQTSKIMQENQNCEIKKNEKITEIDQGVFAGRLKSSMTEQDWENYFSKNKEFGLENNDEIFSRVNDFANELKENYKEKTVLVVTHRAIAKRLLTILKNENRSNEEMFNWKIFDNAEIQKVEI